MKNGKFLILKYLIGSIEPEKSKKRYKRLSFLILIYRFNFLLERREGHKVRIDLFDEDSFSKDDYLGKVLVNVEDYIGNESGENEEGITITLEDDPLQNSSKHPTPIYGDITFQLRYLYKLCDSYF